MYEKLFDRLWAIGYSFVPEFKTNDRRGEFAPVGIMVHHTAGSNDLNVVRRGRAGLPGPLANFYLDRDAPFILTVVADGKANDSGMGSSVVLSEVRQGLRPTGKTAAQRGLADDVNGNPYFWDIECENLGTGQEWPGGQVHVLVWFLVAVCLEAGWSANRIIGHKEWTRRKIDPKGLDMNWLRAAVQERIDGHFLHMENVRAATAAASLVAAYPPAPEGMVAVPVTAPLAALVSPTSDEVARGFGVIGVSYVPGEKA